MSKRFYIMLVISSQCHLMYSSQIQVAKKEAFSIHEAARKGNMDQVKQQLAEGLLVDSLDDSGDTPLYHAVRAGHMSVIEYLLEHNADVSIRMGSDEESVLHFAARYGEKELIKLLLTKKRCVPVTQARTTPLHLAAQYADIEVLALLMPISKLDVLDGAQCKPIHRALCTSSSENALYLINQWPDMPQAVATDLFRDAARNSHPAVMKLLSEKCTLGLPGAEEERVLFTAGLRGNPEVVKQLLERGGDPAKDSSRALRQAVERGHAEVAALLVQAGAFPNDRDVYGNTMLHSALNFDVYCPISIERRVECLQVLFRYGASSNEKNNHGQTPLMYLKEKFPQNCLALEEVLLFHGARLDNQDENGRTVLHLEFQQLLDMINDDGKVVLSRKALGQVSSIFCIWNIDLFLFFANINRSLCSCLVKELSTKESYRRIFTFLCCLARKKCILPKDILVLIFTGCAELRQDIILLIVAAPLYQDGDLQKAIRLQDESIDNNLLSRVYRAVHKKYYSISSPRIESSILVDLPRSVLEGEFGILGFDSDVFNEEDPEDFEAFATINTFFLERLAVLEEHKAQLVNCTNVLQIVKLLKCQWSAMRGKLLKILEISGRAQAALRKNIVEKKPIERGALFDSFWYEELIRVMSIKDNEGRSAYDICEEILCYTE